MLALARALRSSIEVREETARRLGPTPSSLPPLSPPSLPPSSFETSSAYRVSLSRLQERSAVPRPRWRPRKNRGAGEASALGGTGCPGDHKGSFLIAQQPRALLPRRGRGLSDPDTDGPWDSTSVRTRPEGQSTRPRALNPARRSD
eukprot:364662-Chlamydomonas_euryale.AAC.3